jgi:hypothetical protein
MSKEVFEQHPDLKKVYATADGQFFYTENHATYHAKNLDVKTVETVDNENFIEVVEEEELTGYEKEMAEYEAELAKSLADFDPETTQYPEALKLFKALKLESENEKKDTIYPLLVAAKASAQEGINTEA